MTKPSLDDDRILPVTVEEIRAAAQTFHLDLSDDEVEMYAEFMEFGTESYQAVAEAEAPKLPIKYPRETGHRPRPAENPLNAWYWKSSIKGASGGKLAGKRLVIKDNVCVAGLPLMNGSDVFEVSGEALDLDLQVSAVADDCLVDQVEFRGQREVVLAQKSHCGNV